MSLANKFLLFAFVLYQLFGYGRFDLIYAETQWKCGEYHWVNPPSLEDGVFRSTLTAECIMTGGDEKTLRVLADFIKKDVENSGKLQIHDGPTQLTFEGLPALKYDVTDDLKSEGSPASIRQDLLF